MVGLRRLRQKQREEIEAPKRGLDGPVKYYRRLKSREDVRIYLATKANELDMGKITDSRAKTCCSLANSLLKLFTDQEEANSRKWERDQLAKLIAMAEAQGISADLLPQQLLLECSDEENEESDGQSKV
jgi:hypothetical protein